jgi:hypothetical protein
MTRRSYDKWPVQCERCRETYEAMDLARVRVVGLRSGRFVDGTLCPRCQVWLEAFIATWHGEGVELEYRAY